MCATKTRQYDHGPHLSTSQAYVPLIHKFAPEIQEIDVCLRKQNREVLNERSKSHANVICPSGPTIGDL